MRVRSCPAWELTRTHTVAVGNGARITAVTPMLPWLDCAPAVAGEASETIAAVSERIGRRMRGSRESEGVVAGGR